MKEGILITRTDKVGDLILSLPFINTMKKFYSPIYLMVSSYAYPIVEHYPGISKIICYDEGDEKNIGRVKQIVQEIKELNIKTSVSLLYNSDLLSILKKAGVKERISVTSSILAPFKCTKCVYQHRSKVECHELEYNLRVLKYFGIKEKDYDINMSIPISSNIQKSAMEKLKSLGLKNSNYIVIHPCMGGSALNWKYSNYVELSNRLINRLGCSIVLTGVEKEKKTISIIKKHINSNVYDSSGLLTLKELAAVIANSNLFVGPSTGPMHMAVALSVPVVALFSPIRVQSAKRWGPFGKNTEVVAPDVKCEENFKCSEYKCSHYDCMNTIKVDKVFEKALQVYAKNEESEQVGLYF